jgi:peptidoglycan/xylan/chitin deacetylase (PgdA/CDA1 family)
MDDIGASTKRNEVYGKTRIQFGPLRLPFPGNFLFLKYLPGIRKWGPYDELPPAIWTSFFSLLETHKAQITIGVTASWVEDDGTLTPFPKKFPEQAAMLKEAAAKGLVEVANHGLTHCVVEGGQFRPRLFTSNRTSHREFWDWIPREKHRENLRVSQSILQEYLGEAVTTFVPPGNVFQSYTVEFAAEFGIRTLSCKTPTRFADGMAFVGDEHLLPFHDREIALEGVVWLEQRLTQLAKGSVRLIKTLGEELRAKGTLG